MKSISISDFQQYNKFIHDVQNGNPLSVRRYNKDYLVLLTAEDYEKTQEIIQEYEKIKKAKEEFKQLIDSLDQSRKDVEENGGYTLKEVKSRFGIADEI